MTLPRSGPGHPYHPDMTASKGRTRAELGRLFCTCETRLDPGCPIHGVRTRHRSHRGFWALVILAVALGFGVERASAAPFTPELEADYAYAEQWWGAVPAGCSSVTKELVPGAQIEASGRATQPEGPPIPCTIWIAEGLPSACFQREVVLHEYGHLLGYGHSEDPASIMYPTVPGTLCKAEWRANQIVQLERGLQRIQARCRHLERLQRRLCRHTEVEWRQMLAEERN